MTPAATPPVKLELLFLDGPTQLWDYCGGTWPSPDAAREAARVRGPGRYKLRRKGQPDEAFEVR